MKNANVDFVQKFSDAESEIRTLRRKLVKTDALLHEAKQVIVELKQKLYEAKTMQK